MKCVITTLLLLLTGYAVMAQTGPTQNNSGKSMGILISGNAGKAEGMLIKAKNDDNSSPIAEMNYRVLLGVFTHRIPIESDYWAAVRSDLSVTATSGGFAYTVGYYKNYADAFNMCKSLMQKGYQQATVATFTLDKVVEVIQP